MRTIIIAEAGVNHNGDYDTALKLIDAAAETGADYIKFQTFRAEKLATIHAHKAVYQAKNTSESDSSQLNMLKKLEIPDVWYDSLIERCKLRGIKFLSSAFDIESLLFLENIGIDLVKIPSGEITNIPYLRKIASMNKQVILSTGMATLDEVKVALLTLIRGGLPRNKITVLHCNTDYPTPLADVNLRAMLTMKEVLKVRIGYSDHTEGITIPVAAVALGAVVIEKHFTLDRGMVGPDHKASLEPREFNIMVEAIRDVEKAMSGSGKKKPSKSELCNIKIVRKSIVAAKPIRKGEYFTEENLTVKRPATGITPVMWDKVIGKKARMDFEPDDLIKL